MVSSDQKLARIYRSLRDSGIDGLVMGGHAARYYGIDLNTVDFDLVTAITTTEELQSRLPRVPGFEQALRAPVWRSSDFARFEIGKLPDGREEWLEFWIRNHLLDTYANLKLRSEVGTYGGEPVAFLSIADLIRSKETERESDWQDIALLEEIQDSRHFAALDTANDALHLLLTNLRSRRGMNRAADLKLVDDRDAVVEALTSCAHPVTYAFLLPLSPEQEGNCVSIPLDAAMVAAVRAATFRSPRHFALIEVFRRAYKRHAMEVDRADKQAKLRGM